jgi:hypothetical protein
MSHETNAPKEVAKLSFEERLGETGSIQMPVQGLVDSLRSIQEDIGQICELASEEQSFVAAFFASFSDLMAPLTNTLPVSRRAISKHAGNISQAHIDSTGHLIILYDDGKAELKDLSGEANRDLMISVIEDVMPKFKQLTTNYRQKIEKRIEFLSVVTRELQKISKFFSAATAPST